MNNQTTNQLELLNEPTYDAIVVGPHHGEYQIPHPYDSTQKNISIDLDKFENSPMALDNLIYRWNTKNFYINPNKINPEDAIWGFVTIIDLKSTHEFDRGKKSLFTLNRYIKKFFTRVLQANINRTGDDDAFDYCPSFTKTFFDFLKGIGMTQKQINTYWAMLYDIDRQYQDDIENFESIYQELGYPDNIKEIYNNYLKTKK